RLRRCGVVVQRNYEALCAAADDACDVELRRGERAAGEDESLQRRELLLHRVDAVLELLDARELHAGEARRAGGGEVRADLEQVRLRGGELRVDRRLGPACARHTDERVQLVDRAVGFDARVAL